jgi:formate C-acetyltransferase
MLANRLFTAPGRDYNDCHRELIEIYSDLADNLPAGLTFKPLNAGEDDVGGGSLKKIKFDESSGLSLDTIKKEINDILSKDLSRIVKKSEVFELVLTKARINLNPLDWFAGYFEGSQMLSGLIITIREQWRAEYQKKHPEMTQVLNLTYETGAAYSYLDVAAHAAPGWKPLLSRGIPGLLEDAREARKNMACDDKQNDFYDAVEQVCGVSLKWMERLVSEAEKIIENRTEHKDRMEKYAASLRRLHEGPPLTFYDALHLIVMYCLLTEFEGMIVHSLGRFDLNLYPFYERDIEAGIMTREDAKELLRFFCMKFFVKTRGTESMGSAAQNITLGGVLSNGGDAFNDLTLLVLECIEESGLTDPRLSVRFHKGAGEEQYRKIARCICRSSNDMVLINDETEIPALLKQRRDPADVYDYIAIGCYEPSIEGHEIGCNMAIHMNLVKPVELVLFRGRDNLTGKTVGLDTGSLKEFGDFDSFYKAYQEQLRYQVETAMKAVSEFESYWPEINPLPLFSASISDCLKSGKDLSRGGCKYNNTGCMGTGIANAADSLMAVKALVYDADVGIGAITLEELAKILAADWKGYEKLQSYVINRIEKWGNNRREVDGIAKNVADFYTSIVNGVPNSRGGYFTASIFSLHWYQLLGRLTGATPDGRSARAYLAKGTGAVTGLDKSGVTALIQSVTKLDFTNVPNGSVLDVFLHPSAVDGEEGVSALAGLIKTYFSSGGYGIHFNILDTEALKDAQVHPEDYKTLQVRVCGWNVYFVELSKEQQDQFINTTIHA